MIFVLISWRPFSYSALTVLQGVFSFVMLRIAIYKRKLKNDAYKTKFRYLEASSSRFFEQLRLHRVVTKEKILDDLKGHSTEIKKKRIKPHQEFQTDRHKMFFLCSTVARFSK